jgi:hypothetical protein
MKTDRFKTFTATMIALVTVLSALTAWRAAVASQEASQADFNGLVSTVNAGEARVLNTIQVSEHYQAFLIYTRYNDLGYRLYDDLQAQPADADELGRQKSEAWGIAYGLQSVFFPSRYLRPDGSYDSQRELDEAWADAQRRRDTKAELHYSEADVLRSKANLMIAMLMVLGVSLWFFTLAQITEHNVKYLFAFVGGILMLFASFADLIIDLVMNGG